MTITNISSALTAISSIPENAAAVPALWNERYTALNNNLTTVATYLGNERVYNVRNYGAVGNGVIDDTVALQNWLDALATAGGRGYVPDGVYKHDGSITLDTATEVEIEFAGDAWLAPTAGWGLKLDNCSLITLLGPKVRLNSGSTATRGIWVFSSPWVTIERPRVWSFINVPANFIGIDVDDNSYWCDVVALRIRKDSGTLTGTFAKGVRFLNESNAGSVVRGAINNCDVGVYCDGSNGIRVLNNSFETCTYGVEWAESTAAGNVILLVTGNRAENVTYLVEVSDSTLAATAHSIIGDNIMVGGVLEVNNPHGQPIRRACETDFHMKSAASQIVFGSSFLIPSASIVQGSGIVTMGGNVEAGLKGDLDENGNGRVRLAVGTATRFYADQTGLVFFGGTTGIAQQVSGANLTNNVTSGGTDNTIADFTDLTTYANDAAAIRNNIYQLARKLKQVNDALRLYRLLT